MTTHTFKDGTQWLIFGYPEALALWNADNEVYRLDLENETEGLIENVTEMDGLRNSYFGIMSEKSAQKENNYQNKFDEILTEVKRISTEYNQLQTENQQLRDALETMCKFHETNASWDKGNNGYYLAKRLLNSGSRAK